jgi:hypothetical protein
MFVYQGMTVLRKLYKSLNSCIYDILSPFLSFSFGSIYFPDLIL